MEDITFVKKIDKLGRVQIPEKILKVMFPDGYLDGQKLDVSLLDYNGIEIRLEKHEDEDDYCHWIYDKRMAKSKCGSIGMHVIDFKKLRYCPFCRKEIKREILDNE